MEQGLPFKILMVEDDQDDRELIDDAFMEIGYAAEVKKFISAKYLFQYLQKVRPKQYPSLIVLDNQLAGLSASEVLQQLKSSPDYRSIPVMIYATDISAAKKEDLLKKGAIGCIEKGNLMQELIATARQLKDVAEQGAGVKTYR